MTVNTERKKTFETAEERFETLLLRRNIGLAEETRVKAAGETYQDDLYLEVINAVEPPLNAYAEQIENQEWKKWSLKKISAVAQHYLLLASAQASRAKHTIKNPEEKEKILETASQALEKATPLADHLANHEHLKDVNDNPFLWPVEMRRNRARVIERIPEISVGDLQPAVGLYEEAVDSALQIVDQNPEDKKFKESARMVAGTARIEAVLTRLTLRDQGEETAISDETVFEEFERAFQELTTAWKEYPNWDRFDAGLKEMSRVLRKRYPGQKEGLKGKINKRRIELLEEVKTAWDERSAKTAEARLQKLQRKLKG